MSLMVALGLPDGDQTLSSIDTCSFCKKTEAQVGKLAEVGRDKKLACEGCIGKVVNVLDDLQKHGKKYTVPDHD